MICPLIVTDAFSIHCLFLFCVNLLYKGDNFLNAIYHKDSPFDPIVPLLFSYDRDREKNVCATNAEPSYPLLESYLSVSSHPLENGFKRIRLLRNSLIQFQEDQFWDSQIMLSCRLFAAPWQNWCTTFQHHKILVSDVNEKIIFYGIPCCHAETSVRVFFLARNVF